MKKLMIVDDSNIIRNKIERLNVDKLNIVAKARNGLEAIELFKVHQPDIVTMDITMPGMDGLECIKKLVAMNPNVIILVVSALSDKEVGIDALSYGARGFICKPFTEEDLSLTLSRVINGA